MSKTQIKILARLADAMNADPNATVNALVADVAFGMTREAIALGWSDQAIANIHPIVLDTCIDLMKAAA